MWNRSCGRPSIDSKATLAPRGAPAAKPACLSVWQPATSSAATRANANCATKRAETAALIARRNNTHIVDTSLWPLVFALSPAAGAHLPAGGDVSPADDTGAEENRYPARA